MATRIGGSTGRGTGHLRGSEMSKRVLVNFETTPEQRVWFKNAAHAERMSMSAWLRRIAIVRAAEVVGVPEKTTDAK
jgi:hypothetical protein